MGEVQANSPHTLLSYVVPSSSTGGNPIILPPLPPDAVFDFKPCLLEVFESDLFHGDISESPIAHMERFEKRISFIHMLGISSEYLKLKFFPLTLRGKA